MFNNSSVLPVEFNETSIHEFTGWLLCVLWHLQNKTMSYNQAEETCSMYLKEFGTEITVLCWLAAAFIIITNAAVLWGIIGNRELHKPYLFYMANIASADILAGIALLCYPIVGQMEATGMYTRMNIVTLAITSQVLSSSALALQSINSYVAVRYPTYFHNHAGTAKRNAGVAIVSTWLLLSLFGLTPSMGWNCLNMPTPNCLNFFHIAYTVLCGVMILLLACTALFTTISVFITLKQRQKNRFGQPAGAQPLQGNNPTQNRTGQNQPHNLAQNVAERKCQKSLNKIKTVLIHVVVAFTFWFLPLVLIPICQDKYCQLPTGPRGMVVLMTLNSAINPIVSIIRTSELRKGIWKNMTAIYRVLHITALVTMIRGNRDNPQDEQRVPPNVQGGAARGAVQNTPADQPTVEHGNTPVNLAMEGAVQNTPADQPTVEHGNTPVNLAMGGAVQNTPADQSTVEHGNTPVNLAMEGAVQNTPADQSTARTAEHNNTPVKLAMGGAVQNTPADQPTVEHNNTPVNLAMGGPQTVSPQAMNTENVVMVELAYI
ncbi:S1PR1 [Branchiostoma lanceolatum]|uniref:S1PR1 protein n=1 Tax=Branchiostoma lanceolatum TaxID=7740 RepID=A0A8J9V844_BRALA|nr:S1PR1 [Branchiostoma lanceolatum]